MKLMELFLIFAFILFIFLLILIRKTSIRLMPETLSEAEDFIKVFLKYALTTAGSSIVKTGIKSHINNIPYKVNN